MKRALLIIAFLLSSPALTAASAKLAPASKATDMLGEVVVKASADDERCIVYLHDDKVQQGYKIEVGEPCPAAFPVMAKVKAWRIYSNRVITFADADGHDLIRFRGKGYTRFAVDKVDGIEHIWSAQEVAE